MKNPTAGAEATPFPALLSAGANGRAGFGRYEEEGRVDAGHYKALQRVLLTFRVQSAPCSKIKHEMTRQRFARLFFSPSLSNPSASIPRIHPRSLVLLLARDCVCRHTVYRSNVTFFSPLGPRAEGTNCALCRRFYHSISHRKSSVIS